MCYHEDMRFDIEKRSTYYVMRGWEGNRLVFRWMDSSLDVIQDESERVFPEYRGYIRKLIGQYR